MADDFLTQQQRYYDLLRRASWALGRVPGAFSWLPALGVGHFPDPEPPGFAAPWPEGAWGRYLRAKVLATALMYRIRDLPQVVKLSIDDASGCFADLHGRGGVLLTYHHPFAYHLPAILGHWGLRLNVLALSPAESPLYPLYERCFASWFADCESVQRGGRWFYLQSSGANAFRAPMADLMAGVPLISLHDFNNFYPGAREIEVSFMGRQMRVPLGVIKSACKAGLPMCCAYVDWREGREFVVRFLSLHERDATPTPEGVLARYFEHLAELVSVRPEFWEMWPTLG